MDKIVLICAVGRSGSTTLQLVLNSIPNSNICGENNGAIHHLLNFYKEVKFTHQKVHTEFNAFNDEDKKDIFKLFSSRTKPSWYNSFELKDIQSNIRSLIIAMFKKNEYCNLWGFKEIRYQGKMDLLHEFLELFPNTKVVIHIRENIMKQSKSAWYKSDPNAFQKIKAETNELIEFYKTHSKFCFLNTLERMYNRQHMMNLFGFIGCKDCFQDVEEKIKYILLHSRES